VNFSSIRAGVLEDREIFKGLQNWFIRSMVKVVYEDFIVMGITSGAITILGRQPARTVDEYLPAHYQGRRWPWVDPQKDGQGNQIAVNMRTRSVSSLIRDQGDDPEEVFAEIEEENAKMRDMKIIPIQTEVKPNDDEKKPDD
jgi:capsid protein